MLLIDEVILVMLPCEIIIISLSDFNETLLLYKVIVSLDNDIGYNLSANIINGNIVIIAIADNIHLFDI